MLASFSEFKFYQSFRMNVEEADNIRFLIEVPDRPGAKGHYIDDGKLMDISITGLGFKTKEKLSVGSELEVSLQFKKVHLDLTVIIVRAFSSVDNHEEIIYGVEFEEESEQVVKKFLETFINSFSPDRLKDCLIQSTMREKYSSATEGFEMLSLLLSLFKDIINFSEQDNFVENVLEEITRVLNAQKAILFLINPEKNELRAVSSVGFNGEEIQFDYRQGIAGSVFTTGVSLNLDANSNMTKFEDNLESVAGVDTQSIICNAIQNREDKNIGVLQVINKRNSSRFDLDDEKTMKVLSLVLSTIFHNYNPISEKSRIRRFSAPYDRKLAFIGKSQVAGRLRTAIVKLKDLDTPVLLHGESGVGKSFLAQIIHNEGRRGLNQFIPVHCGGFSEEEIHNEIFGFEGHTGKIEEAHGGTIFFHEIHLLPLNMQKELVEKFQYNKLKDSEKELNIRVFTSSTQDLEELVDKGEFNKDLFEFISQTQVEVEPLRSRKDDVKYLVEYFLKKSCKEQGLLGKSFSPRAMDTFENYDWPGNISELKKCVERAVLYNPKAHVIGDVSDGATPLLDKSKSVLKVFDDLPHISDSTIPLKERMLLLERKIIEAEIKKHSGNKSKAAKIMGISREALRKKLLNSGSVQEKLSDTKKAA